MKVAAYCRVSTDKTDQLNSLETQKAFFEQYCDRNGLILSCIYADEGISGTKTRNRYQFLKMMQDAGNGQFTQVIVKDVSRLARNTVDFLTSIRKLKELNIETIFITSEMRSLGNSEFVLTLMGAMAQEESQNTSKRVKFGKKENAKRGRVPNLVYGYDKIPGDYFNLVVNDNEAIVVKRIFSMYVEEGHGAGRIAMILNQEGLRTKRGSLWSQNAVSRILKNEIYIGRVVNGKEEVSDFLTGHRRPLNEADRMITERPDLAIVSNEMFKAASKALEQRCNDFNIEHERHSNAYIFSTLVKCNCCGFSYRRITREYKNIYNSWVCSGRNSRGTGACANNIKLPEEWLLEQILTYINSYISLDCKFNEKVIDYYLKVRKNSDISVAATLQLKRKRKSLADKIERLKNLYINGLIELNEMQDKTINLKTELVQIDNDIQQCDHSIIDKDNMRSALLDTVNSQGILCPADMTNAVLKSIIDKIEVNADGKVYIVIKI